MPDDNYSDVVLAWRHITRILAATLSNAAPPPLKKLAFDYSENGYTLYSGVSNFSLPPTEIELLESQLLSIPTLQEVEFRPVEHKTGAQFNEMDKMHVEGLMPRLKERDLLKMSL